jgi:acyl carrier protein
MTEGERLMDSIVIQDIGDVEAALAAFPGAADVSVVEHNAESMGQCLVAYVTSSGRGLDVPALHAHARKLLPGRMVPAAIVVLDAASAGGTDAASARGTTDHLALPVPDLGGLTSYRAPDTARQETLCEIFAEVLRVPRVGVDDSFFNLGGQSVDAIMLASRISTALGIGMSMADLFAAPTVVELDLRLDAAMKAR